MEIDKHGQVLRREFHDGVINSNERMTYTAVNGILTDRDPEALQVLRHSTAHVMAQAVLHLWPDAKIAIGPAIANAIHDAIGVRFRHYPIRPEQVLQALRE